MPHRHLLATPQTQPIYTNRQRSFITNEHWENTAQCAHSPRLCAPHLFSGLNRPLQKALIVRMIKSANPIKRIPLSLKVSFVLALSFQMSVSQINTPVSLTGRTIPAPPKYELLQALSLGSPAWLSRVLALWLQSQDVQPGKTLSLNELNYDTIRAWLEVQLKLDKNNHYPFMAALHYYGNVRNPQKLRKMLAFVEQNFTEKPETYWRWMAEAVIKATHV